MKEIWKDIIGYEGFYKISNTGKVLGVKRNKLLKPGYSGGKLMVNLNKYDLGTTFTLKKLVYNHFIGECNTMIDHIDGDFRNCGIDNLIAVHKTIKFRKQHCTQLIDVNTKESYNSINDLSRNINVPPHIIRLSIKSTGRYLNYERV